MQVLVPPGFGQDVREWQSKKQFPGLDVSRPPSSLDGPISPGDVRASTSRDLDKHEGWDTDNGKTQ